MMKKISTSFLIFAILIAIISSCSNPLNRYSDSEDQALSRSVTSGTAYYIDSVSGNDANAGTSETSPWKSLSKVNTKVFSSGDRIFLKAGSSWNGQLKLQGSGTAAEPIIIDQYGTGNKPLIMGGGTPDLSGAVEFIDVEYWEVNNLEVTNDSAYPAHRYGILIENQSISAGMDHIYVKNCYVHDVNGNTPSNYSAARHYKMTGGIIAYSDNYYFNDILIEDNHVKSVDHEGIRTKNASSARSSNVVIRNNYLEDIGGDAIVISEVNTGGLVEYNISDGASQRSDGTNYAAIWAYQGTDNIIQYNSAINTGWAPNDGNGYDIDNGCQNVVIQYNYSYNNDGGFVLIMNGSTNGKVRYNISENDRRRVIMNLVGTNNWFYNNTIYIEAGMSTPVMERWSSSTSPYYFYNNIVVNKGTGEFHSDLNQSGVGGLVSDYNLYYGNHPSDEPNESNKIVADPMLINPGTVGENHTLAGAYMIDASSPAVNSGKVISSNGGKDYFGNSLYAGAPDIGAHEHPDGGTITDPGEKPDGFDAVADAYVRDGSYADTNYGSDTDLTIKKDAVGYSRKSYIKFDFNSLQGSSVSNAELNLYIDNVNTDVSRTVSIYGTAVENWSENNITWNNSPAGTVYLTSFSVQPDDAGTWISIDITNYINNNLSDKVVSFLLVNEGTASSKNDFYIASRENTSDRPPVLTITATGSETYNSVAEADSYIRDGSYANNNYGSDATLFVKNDAVSYSRKSLMRFDYGSYSDSAVSSAELELFVSNVNSDPSRTISVYQVDEDNWQEYSVTWNNAPAAGVKIADLVVTPSDLNTWVTIDITSAINGNMGDKKLSLILVNESSYGSKTDVQFASRESSTKPLVVLSP